VILAVRQTIQKKEDQRKERDKKLRKELKERVKVVGTLDRSKMESWSSKECKVFLQFKKSADDPAMPKVIGAMRQRCQEWISRPSP
jgi:flagellar motility protein MotE (MotC chaperone)